MREEHTAINMNMHYLENGTVMLNFIYQKELFFLPLGFVLKVNKPAAFVAEQIVVNISHASNLLVSHLFSCSSGPGGLHRVSDLPGAHERP